MLLCLSAGRRFIRSSLGGMVGILDLSGASLTPDSLQRNFLTQRVSCFLLWWRETLSVSVADEASLLGSVAEVSLHLGYSNPPICNASVFVSSGLSILAATARYMRGPP